MQIRRRVATNLQTRSTDMAREFTYRLLTSTSTVAFYYYYSPRKDDQEATDGWILWSGLKRQIAVSIMTSKNNTTTGQQRGLEEEREGGGTGGSISSWKQSPDDLTWPDLTWINWLINSSVLDALQLQTQSDSVIITERWRSPLCRLVVQVSVESRNHQLLVFLADVTDETMAG